MPESPQAVAYALLQKIAEAENWSGSTEAKNLTDDELARIATGAHDGSRAWTKTRAEILDAYKECLTAVLGQYTRWGPYASR